MSSCDQALSKSLELMNQRARSDHMQQAFNDLKKAFGFRHFPHVARQKAEQLKKSHQEGHLTEQEFMAALNSLEQLAKNHVKQNS